MYAIPITSTWRSEPKAVGHCKGQSEQFKAKSWTWGGWQHEINTFSGMKGGMTQHVYVRRANFSTSPRLWTIFSLFFHALSVSVLINSTALEIHEIILFSDATCFPYVELFVPHGEWSEAKPFKVLAEILFSSSDLRVSSICVFWLLTGLPFVESLKSCF